MIELRQEGKWLPADVQTKLYKQIATPSGDTEHYGKIHITGTFEFGGPYGYSNGYTEEVIVTGATYINWTPTPSKTAAS